jgi:hypothetical protein
MVDLLCMRVAAPRTLLGLLAIASAANAQAANQAPARKFTAWVVGAKAEPRTQALIDVLRGGGLQVRVLERAGCGPEALRTAHVVVVDWPTTEPLGERLPLGAYERWDRPTVFLGSAGTRFAERWGLPTSATLAANEADARWPGCQRWAPPAPARSEVWRQGNLFQFGVDDTFDPCAVDERVWLVQTVLAAIPFGADRPVFAHAVPAGSEVPVVERERRQRVLDGCKRFGMEPGELAGLFAMPNRIDLDDGSAAEAWLLDAVPGSCLPGTSANNWKNWIGPRLGKLVWDPLSVRFRVDELAYRRGVDSAALLGDARGEPGPADVAALALAAKVVQHHGGAAFADLTTFSCWLGDYFCQWDRRAGVFRVENFVEIPAGNLAMPWELAVFDTAADTDLIRGGGPEPRPFVSARGTFGDLVEQVFLPVVLLEPGVSVRRLADQDADGKQALAVRFGWRGIDPKVEFVLLVDPATGAVDQCRRMVRGRLQRSLYLVATAACGPLRVPVAAKVEQGRTRRDLTIADAKWNPDLPTDLATATVRLAVPRDK